MACDGHNIRTQKGIRWMRVCHGFSAVFDDPNLVSCAGLVPVLRLAERAGLRRLVAGHVSIRWPPRAPAPARTSTGHRWGRRVP